MKPITSIRNADIGRVAVSRQGGYQIRVLDITKTDEDGGVYVQAKDIIEGTEWHSFKLIKGQTPMFWLEDSAKYSDYPEMTLDISAAVHASANVNQTRDVMSVMAYLTSETGECADWLVNPDRRKEDLLGECADVIICALDLALVHKAATSSLDGQELAEEVISHLNDLLKIKAEKWLDKHAKV